MTVLGFDIAHVPTADLMELAAKLLESDALALDKVRALAGIVGVSSSPGTKVNHELATALRERAGRVRELETQ